MKQGVKARKRDVQGRHRRNKIDIWDLLRVETKGKRCESAAFVEATKRTRIATGRLGKERESCCNTFSLINFRRINKK